MLHAIPECRPTILEVMQRLMKIYDFKRIKLLIEIKKLIKDQGIKPEKISNYLKNKRKPKTQQVEIKKELVKIKKIIKNASKL